MHTILTVIASGTHRVRDVTSFHINSYYHIVQVEFES